MSRSTDFDVSRFLPYLLNQAAEKTSRGFQQVYQDRYGMLRTEWRVLFHLGQFKKMTATEICQRAMMNKTKISRAVFDLEQKGFLKRTPHESDRRVEILSLTKSGKAAFSDLRSEAAAYETALVPDLPPEALEAIKDHLVKLMAQTE